jgi:putative hydrolase of the HAD superfamily
MPVSAIDTVIFDMDDVLCNYDCEARLDHMARSIGLEREAIIEAIWTSGFDEAADKGAYTADEYLVETQRRLGVAITRGEWVAARRAGTMARSEVLEIAGCVAERATIACLTNNGPLMREHINEIFPEAYELFGEQLFFSCDLPAAKPDPKAFRTLVTRLGSEPKRTLFIDDDEGYVLGAASAGLHVHRYTDAETLVHQLRNFALI